MICAHHRYRADAEDTNDFVYKGKKIHYRIRIIIIINIRRMYRLIHIIVHPA